MDRIWRNVKVTYSSQGHLPHFELSVIKEKIRGDIKKKIKECVKTKKCNVGLM